MIIDKEQLNTEGLSYTRIYSDIGVSCAIGLVFAHETHYYMGAHFQLDFFPKHKTWNQSLKFPAK